MRRHSFSEVAELFRLYWECDTRSGWRSSTEPKEGNAMSSNPKAVHYLDYGYNQAQIACGRKCYTGEYSQDWRKVSCYKCARNASGITDAQREYIWDSANERLDKYKKSPFVVKPEDREACERDARSAA